MNRINLLTRFRLVGALALLFLASCELGTPTNGGGTEGEGVVGSLADPSGQKLAGVWVKAYPVQAALTKSGESSVAVVESVQTNANGVYHFKGLSAGVYNFTATTTASGTTYALFLQSVIVTAGENQMHGDTLKVSGTVTFQVQAGGQGVAGALCFIAGSPWSAISDANGTCTLTGLPPGTLQFSVSHPAFATVLTQAASVASGIVINGGVVVANNTTTLSRLVKISWPDSIFVQGLGTGSPRFTRVVFRKNGVLVKDTVLLPNFPAPGSIVVNYRELNVGGGDSIRVFVFGRISGFTDDTWAGPDTTSLLYQGTHLTSLVDLPGDTLPVSLTWVGYQPQTQPALIPFNHTFPLYTIPDKITQSATGSQWDIRLQRVVLKVNGQVLKDTIGTPFFTPLTNLALTYSGHLPQPADSVEILIYGRTVNGPYDLMAGWDTTRALYRGQRAISSTERNTDTLLITLNWVGPTGIPETPTLQSHLTTVVPLSDTLRWSSVALAETYHVQMATDSVFVNLVLNDSSLATTKRAYGPLNPGYYFWRVRAKNSARGTGAWSAHTNIVTVGAAGATSNQTATPDSSTPLPRDTVIPTQWNPPAPPDSNHADTVGQDTIIIPNPIVPALRLDTVYTDTGFYVRWVQYTAADTIVTSPWNPPTPPDTSWMDTLVQTPWEPTPPPDSVWMDTVSATKGHKLFTRVASNAMPRGAETFRLAVWFDRSLHVRLEHRDAGRLESRRVPQKTSARMIA